MNKKIQSYIYENSDIIVKFLTCYIIGIVIGFCILNFTSGKNEYIEDVNNVLSNISKDNFDKITVITNGIKNNSVLILICYASLLTFISPIILLTVCMVKSISNSIYTFSIFKVFGLGKGLLFFFTCNLIPMLFNMAAYILLSVNIIHTFSMLKSAKNIHFRDVLKHVFLLMICISLICFSLVFEEILVSFFINLYSSI